MQGGIKFHVCVITPAIAHASQIVRRNRVHTLLLGISLLLNVVLSTTLLRLARVVQTLVVLLASLVTSKASDGAADGSLDTVANARSVIVELALGFLRLTLKILLATLLLEIL